jgi:hypothetical protein
MGERIGKEGSHGRLVEMGFFGLCFLVLFFAAGFRIGLPSPRRLSRSLQLSLATI